MGKIYDESEIKNVAAWVWQTIQPGKVVALYGDMGSGKTTLVHAICDYLKVEDTVSSPTFSIINEYAFEEDGQQQTIYHMDLYRIKDEAEAIMAGVEDCLYSGSYCFVEWPEQAPNLLPAETVKVFISVAGDQKRRIEIEEK
jgi:tRNA threonylcarbamoyladenosine biosynthesis protein TsaE